MNFRFLFACGLWFMGIPFSGVKAKPNIIFIVADDMGWNDIGYNNPDVLTPNLNNLASNGIKLNMSYAQPVCTPSRSAYMSGWYPFKTGLQHKTIKSNQPSCASFPNGTLPEALKNEGYTTRMIGKWHLGFCKWACTPTYVGFDSFFGFYNGAEGYNTHKTAGYLDFRDDTVATDAYRGDYSTTLFAEKAVEIIENHPMEDPLFLYLAFQTPHEPQELLDPSQYMHRIFNLGTDSIPEEVFRNAQWVPQYYEDLYADVTVEGRRKYQGMVSALDDAVGNVYDALVARGMETNTVIVFTSDNGGNLNGYSSNWPLRGGKVTIWEGGTRVPGFVNGYGLQQTGITWNGMIHAVDWMPTFIKAAGGTPPNGLDGVSQWEALMTGGASARTEFIYNIDTKTIPKQGRAAIRMGDYKLIEGYPGAYDGWYEPFTESEETIETIDYRRKQQNDILLFNIADDPEEKFDLSSTLTDKVDELRTKLYLYMEDVVEPNYPDSTEDSEPGLYFNNIWSPGWC